MEELKNLLTLLGLSPLWASVIILLAVVVAFFAKRYFDQRTKLEEIEATHRKKLEEIEATYRITHRAKIDDRLLEYAPVQVKALLEAYRMLYDSEVAQTAKGLGFSKIVQEADEMIMKPFTDFSSHLGDPIKSRIYGIHSVLEQFRYDPSEGAIRDFKKFKGKFYNDFIRTAIETIEQSVKGSGDKK